MIALLLLACRATPETTTCSPTAADGQMSATIDAADWSGSASFLWAGESLQLNTENAGAGWITMVAQGSSTGNSVQVDADAQAFPITVSLVSSGGGFATYYPASGNSFSTNNAAGGSLSISNLDESTAEGCFRFEAAGDDGTVTVEEGSFVAHLSVI